MISRYILIRDFSQKDPAKQFSLHFKDIKDEEIENELMNSDCQAWILTTEELQELTTLLLLKRRS